MKETFIERLSKHIQSQYNLQKQELTVVFPNKRAAFYLRSAITKSCNQNIWLPQMLSIQEAVTQWSGMSLVDNIDMMFELIDIDASLNHSHDTDLSIFGSQATQMAKDFDEIDQYDVDAEHLFKYVVENKKLEIWNFDEEHSKEKELKYLNFFTSLYGYYIELRKRLSAESKGYYGMITRYLAHLSDEALCDKIGNRNIIFAGFNALTTTEDALIDKLVKNGKAEIIFDYDKYYVEDPINEAGLFARRYLNTHPNWMKNGLSDSLLTDEKQIHIVSASGHTIQAKALQANLQSDGESDTAIILADEKLLIPTLNAIPDTYSDFKVSMGYPVSKTPVSQLIKEYFTIQRWNKISRKITEKGIERTIEGWYIWPIFRIMDLEIVKIIFNEKEIATFNHWKAESSGNGKFIFEEIDLEAFKSVTDLQTFLRLLLRSEKGKEAFSPKTYIQTLCQLLLFISNKIQKKENPKDYLFLLNQVSEVGKALNRIELVIDRHADYVKDLKSVEILYRLLSSGISIKLNSSSTDGLQIMGLLETRNLDFSRLHVLSVNEGILPTDKSQSSFIPAFIKRECGLPGYIEKQAVFAYHFYRLLQNGDDIYLYYNNLGSDSGGEPSRFILQIRNEMAKRSNIHISEQDFNSNTQNATPTFDIIADKGPAMEKLRQLICEEGLSPTALSAYTSCTLRYYLKYVIGIKDNSIEEETGANIIGTVIHDTLELLFNNHKDEIISKELFDQSIKPQWEKMLAQSIEQNLPHGLTDIGYNYLNKIAIHHQLSNYLDYTSRQLKDNTLVIKQLEGGLETTCQTSIGECKLKGRADRIDHFGDVLRIIDYKTGHVEDANLKLPIHYEGIDDLEYLKSIPEKALQLLMYQYMYLKENESEQTSKVQGVIHALKNCNHIEFPLKKTEPSKKDPKPVSPFLTDDLFIADMEKMIQALVAEMTNPEIPFVQTEDEKNCKNCDFKDICNR